MIKKRYAFISILMIAVNILLAAHVSAFTNPTKGKPFFSWIWNDQIKPTFHGAFDKTGVIILGLGTFAAVVAHQYDDEIHGKFRDDPERLMSENCADFFSALGAGPALIAVAMGQVLVDQENGLMHTRAITFTSLTHLTLSISAQRERPDGSNDYFAYCSSFPSGHTAHVFASASALNYAYGWKVGIPSFAAATSVAVARMSQDKHWASDVVAGATIGLFWANASHNVKKDSERKNQSMFIPIPYNGGGMITYIRQF